MKHKKCRACKDGFDYENRNGKIVPVLCIYCLEFKAVDRMKELLDVKGAPILLGLNRREIEALNILLSNALDYHHRHDR